MIGHYLHRTQTHSTLWSSGAGLNKVVRPKKSSSACKTSLFGPDVADLTLSSRLSAVPSRESTVAVWHSSWKAGASEWTSNAVCATWSARHDSKRVWSQSSGIPSTRYVLGFGFAGSDAVALELEAMAAVEIFSGYSGKLHQLDCV